MGTTYDEDLNENSFFQVLQTEQSDLFHKASSEGWVICVPRAGSLPKYTLTDEDFLSHILVPSDELPESHFRTLSDKEVKICNRVISIEQNDISRPYSTHILFEETFYTNDFLKFKVLCIESPLERHADLGGQSDESRIVTVQTLRDCIDLLWTESGGKEVFERMDEAIHTFLKTDHVPSKKMKLQVLRDHVGGLYTLCLRLILKDMRLREKTRLDNNLLENIKLSVETYMHHGIYKKLMKSITGYTAHDDAYLNKIIRNLADVQLRDLQVRSDLYDAVPYAKCELARIDCYSTVLGKIGCLKRMVAAISKTNVRGTSVEMVGNAIAADDLLSVVVFLIIKSGLPNWTAHLTYMKQFRFSTCTTCHADEHSFLITTLEAAFEHIKSGILYGPSAPEAQHVYEDQIDDLTLGETVESKSNTNSGIGPTGTSCIAYFFEQVKLDNIEKVKDILSEQHLSDTNSDKTDILPNLCHPLCSCDRCESLLKKNLCDTKPTALSSDDRGFTALHVACLFGRPLIVELLLSAGSKVDASDYSGSTSLHYAAAKGHQNALLLLLHSKATIDICDNDGNTPLHLASNNGHDGCVKALLYFAEHNGVKLNTNCRNSNGDTPLHNAARWGYESIVEILLSYGASPTVENNRHCTPLTYAYSFQISNLLSAANNVNTSALEVSVDKESKLANEANTDSRPADISIATKPALDFTDSNGRSNEVGRQERRMHGIRPNCTDEIKKVERLLRAIAFGDTRLACYYLGLDGPNSSDVVQRSVDVKSLCHPLCMCEKCRPKDNTGNDVDLEDNATVNKEILNVNVCNSDGFTPLHVSAMHGRIDLVRMLLDAGAHTNIVTRTKGVTALHLACQNQRIQVVRLLLQSGDCDINIQDARGNTALHYASFTSNSRLVELLLKHSPVVDLKNCNGKTPLDEAEEKLALSVVRLLKGNKTAVCLPWEENKEL